MKTKIFFLSFFILVIIITSCKKSNSSSSQGNTINGNWYFVSFSANTQSTTEYSSGGTDYKNVSISDYTSSNNGGTVSFASNTMTGTNITYYISATVFATDYENGVEVQMQSAPYSYYFPPTNTSSSYTVIGSDSVSFPSGSFTSGPGQSGGIGAKIAFSGDTVMTLTSTYNKDSIGFLYGENATFNNQATLVTTFHR